MSRLLRFNELKEWNLLKPSNLYGSKNINVSKMDIDSICDFIGIDSNNIKYLSSGAFGDAYSVGDKVLKLTIDKREAQTAWNSIPLNNPGLIKYYGVWQYPKKNNMIYVILMDKVIPLVEFIEKKTTKGTKDYIELCEEICDIFYWNWKDLTYDKLVDDVTYIVDSGLSKKITLGMWEMYQNIKVYNILDIHIHNIGVTKDEKIVMFDATPVRLRVRRFDNCPIIKF